MRFKLKTNIIIERKLLLDMDLLKIRNLLNERDWFDKGFYKQLS